MNNLVNESVFLNRFFQRVVLLLNLNHRNQLTIRFSYSLIKSHLNHSWMNQCFWLNSRSEWFNDSQYKNDHFLFSVLKESGDWMIQLLGHRFVCFILKLIIFCEHIIWVNGFLDSLTKIVMWYILDCIGSVEQIS